MRRIALALLLLSTVRLAHAVPAVTVEAKIGNTPVATGGTVTPGTVVAYTISVRNTDVPAALRMTATATYEDQGVQQSVSADCILNVTRYVRPVITVMVPSVLAVDPLTITTSGQWPNQSTQYDVGQAKLVWQGGDLAAGQSAACTFSGKVR